MRDALSLLAKMFGELTTRVCVTASASASWLNFPPFPLRLATIILRYEIIQASTRRILYIRTDTIKFGTLSGTTSGARATRKNAYTPN
jgi:hypothetical protein